MAIAGTITKADLVETKKADWTELRWHVDQRLVAMETYRYSWWVHWREIADYILPRRYKWLVTPNQWNRGSPINQRIINNTATMALRNLAAGLMSGITSPSRPWFRLGIQDTQLSQNDDVRMWLDDSTSRMMMVMAQSNYYTAKAMQLVDLPCFGTAPMLIYEDVMRDHAQIIRCFNPCAGEYYCSTGPNFTVDVLYRKFAMTIAQIVEEFGIDNVGPDTKSMFLQGGAALEQERIIGHAIEPNVEFTNGAGQKTGRGIPKEFAYQEVYWEYGSRDTTVLRVKGFLDAPFSCPRWDLNGNDPYGRSPCMDALGDVKSLQTLEKRAAQGLDKMVNPPMMAGIEMKNQPASLLPGDVTYVQSTAQGVGFKPVFEANIRLDEISKYIEVVVGRIKDTLFNDLFLMISNLDTVRTATEIDARKEEKLMMLGPVLERFQTESLGPDIRRIYNIMMRNGLFMKPPPVMMGMTVEPQYISSLADQQRASITTAIERFVAFVGNLAGADSSAVDKVDFDAVIDEYGDALRVPAKAIRSGSRLAAVREARQKQSQAVAAQQQSMAAVQGAQTLSETDVGGGQNALQMMLQGGGLGAAPPAGNA
jgi:hypothetical protein